MKRRHKLLISCGLLACVGGAGFAIGFWSAAPAEARSPNARLLNTVLSKIKAGEFGIDTNAFELIRLGEDFDDFQQWDYKNRIFQWVVIYSGPTEHLIIYSKDGQMFAAQYVNLSTFPEESWLFCDVARMSEYLNLASSDGQPGN